MASWLDHRLSPMLQMVFPAEYSYEELDAQFDALEAHYERIARERPEEKVGLLVDTTAITQSTARNRKRIAESHARLAPSLGPRAVGQAFVMNGAVVRGALTAILWLKQVPWPVKVFASRAEAESWLRERFDEAGVRVPVD